MAIFDSKDLPEDVQAKDLCIDCGASVALYPHLKSHKGKIATLYPCNLTEGRCHAYCPKMDIPPPPADAMVLKNVDGGRRQIPLSEIKPLIPHTCLICPDLTSEFADISVGMYEGHPGTPSSEFADNLAKVARERNLYAAWSVNEKVALEVGHRSVLQA